LVRPAVLYGSECQATKVRDERKVRMDRIRNEYIRGSFKVAPVFEKMTSNSLVWACYAER
jgi:hypothetical protein